MKNWFAVYTKPRWEKKVNKKLHEKGITSYCPINKVRKKWSDRYKIVEEPLFKSYVFVHIGQEESQEVRLIDGVVNFVYWNGKPAMIRDWEISDIKRFLDEYDHVELVALDLKPNSKVLIHRGVMMGKEAIVERVLNNFVELKIESLGYKLIAKIEKSKISLIEG